MHYRLSKRQIRQMRVRGRLITIAIPQTATSNPDPLAFAKRMLPDHVNEIRSAGYETIAVDPFTNSPDLAGLIGAVVGDGGVDNPDLDHEPPHMLVCACIVELGPKHPRGEVTRPQWPAVMVNGDFSWPKCYREATADA